MRAGVGWQVSEVGVRRRKHTSVNFFEHAIHVLTDLVVPETDHSISFALQPLRPASIALKDRFNRVLTAVDFNHEPRPHTGEIDHIGTDRDLDRKSVV